MLQSTMFRDEIDFIRKLNQYTQQTDRLRPTTSFCTFTITNYDTLDFHSTMIEKVDCFLLNNVVTNKVDQLTMQTVKNLLHIVLSNNIFQYKDTIYLMMKGCPTSMPLSATLSSIYVSLWEKGIFKELRSKNEFFGRYNLERK
jgi:hypothetical protein